MLEAALEGRGKGEFNATTHCGGGGGGRADMMAMKEEGGSKKRAPLGRGQGRIRGSTPQLPLHSAFVSFPVSNFHCNARSCRR